MALSRLLGGLWTVTKVEGWAGAPLLPGFILLGVCDWRFWPVGGGGGASLWAVSKVESSVGVPRLHRFILLRSFSDTLLVVSVLDIVMIALCSRLCSPEGVKTIKLLQTLSLTISLI